MKRFSYMLVMLGLVGCNASGGSSDLPEMKGKLTNHTPFQTEDFEVSATLQCFTQDLMGYHHPCDGDGADSVTLHPSSDGSFTIRPLHVNKSGSEYKFTATVTLPERVTGKLIYSRRTAVYDFTDGFDKIAELANLTAFYLPEQKLNFRPASGMNSEAWANSTGHDVTVHYSLNFGGTLTNLFSSGEEEIQGDSTKTIARLPERILFVNQELPADAQVMIQGELKTRSLNPNPATGWLTFATLRTVEPFASQLPEEARTFTFDDSQLLKPNKSLSGKWKVVFNFHDGYVSGSESNFYDGTLDAACVQGRIQGAMTLQSRPANPHPFAGSVPVTGTCQGEEGQIEFQFQYASNHPEQKIVIPYSRIQGNSEYLVSSEVDTQEGFAGAVFTRSLALHDAANRIVGRGTVER